MCMPRQYTLERERQDVYNLAMQTLSHLPLQAKGVRCNPLISLRFWCLLRLLTCPFTKPVRTLKVRPQQRPWGAL